jgi:hypothetical protein
MPGSPPLSLLPQTLSNETWPKAQSFGGGVGGGGGGGGDGGGSIVDHLLASFWPAAPGRATLLCLAGANRQQLCQSCASGAGLVLVTIIIVVFFLLPLPLGSRGSRSGGWSRSRSRGGGSRLELSKLSTEQEIVRLGGIGTDSGGGEGGAEPGDGCLE